MNKFKNGISIIVLVITIIILVMLAGAVIITLSNVNIISKGNEAVAGSNTANIKDYIQTLTADWLLIPESEKTDKTYTEYVNEALANAGFKREINEDGVLLSENATFALKSGLKVGNTVEGYNEYLTSRTVHTSGNENTGETDTATSQDVNNKTDFEWKYIGVNNDGEMLIAAEVTSDTPTVKLSGKGGYLNGPSELDTLCAKLYSTSKGKARSMNIDDVNKLLGYIGEKGAYYNQSNNYTPTTEVRSIGSILGELNLTLTVLATPDGTDVASYNSDYYSININYDIGKMNNKENVGLVYYTTSYWLASPCVGLHVSRSGVGFGVRFVKAQYAASEYTFQSTSTTSKTKSLVYALRPVVAISSDVIVTYDGETHTLILGN